MLPSRYTLLFLMLLMRPDLLEGEWKTSRLLKCQGTGSVKVLPPSSDQQYHLWAGGGTGLDARVAGPALHLGFAEHRDDPA